MYIYKRRETLKEKLLNQRKEKLKSSKPNFIRALRCDNENPMTQRHSFNSKTKKQKNKK